MKTPRQLRRAEERRLRNRNRKPESAPAAPTSAFSVEAPPPTTEAPRSTLSWNFSDPPRAATHSHPSDPVRPPLSEAKLAANQANAQHSTGPRTPEGKATSSRNSLRHGFTGTFSVLPGESEEEFDLVCYRYRQEYQPRTVTEYDLVNNMARHWWLTQRAIRYQDTVLPHCVVDPFFQKLLALYIRYQTTNERAFHKCLDTLLQLRKYRAKEANGFVSQNRSQRPQKSESPAENPASLPLHSPSEHLDRRTNSDLPPPSARNHPGAEAPDLR